MCGETSRNPQGSLSLSHSKDASGQLWQTLLLLATSVVWQRPRFLHFWLSLNRPASQEFHRPLVSIMQINLGARQVQASRILVKDPETGSVWSIFCVLAFYQPGAGTQSQPKSSVFKLEDDYHVLYFLPLSLCYWWGWPSPKLFEEHRSRCFPTSPMNHRVRITFVLCCLTAQ